MVFVLACFALFLPISNIVVSERISFLFIMMPYFFVLLPDSFVATLAWYSVQ